MAVSVAGWHAGRRHGIPSTVYRRPCTILPKPPSNKDEAPHCSQVAVPSRRHAVHERDRAASWQLPLAPAESSKALSTPLRPAHWPPTLLSHSFALRRLPHLSSAASQKCPCVVHLQPSESRAPTSPRPSKMAPAMKQDPPRLWPSSQSRAPTADLLPLLAVRYPT
jgi:hypothetical protein